MAGSKVAFKVPHNGYAEDLTFLLGIITKDHGKYCSKLSSVPKEKNLRSLSSKRIEPLSCIVTTS